MVGTSNKSVPEMAIDHRAAGPLFCLQLPQHQQSRFLGGPVHRPGRERAELHQTMEIRIPCGMWLKIIGKS